MEINIHRGINQIGGCITEITTASSSVFIDLGHSLPKGDIVVKDNKANRSAIEKLTANSNAIFYTHYHGDHVDLFKYVPTNVEQYIGGVAKKIIKCKYEILSYLPNGKLIKPIDIQLLDSFKTYRENQRIKKGNITITPYFVSHSACDAYMFLIEADGKRVLHTGDFREHGYLGKGLLKTIQTHILKHRKIDVLITEGTMLSRLDERVKHESELKQEITLLMKEYKYVFALCSSTDIDRLATFYQASKANKRSFLCDNYQKKVLSIFTETAGTRSKLYKFDKAYYYSHENEEQFSLLEKKGFCMLIRGKHFYQVRDLLTKLPKDQTLLIYSKWNGYIKDGENQKNSYVSLYNLFENKKCIHTSGHASPESLAKVCNMVNPTTAIIPIHSEKSDEFNKLSISEDLKAKIVTHSVARNNILIRVFEGENSFCFKNDEDWKNFWNESIRLTEEATGKFKINFYMDVVNSKDGKLLKEFVTRLTGRK
ncbi:MBL fold metallo-hydrolase [Petrimonas sp.]|uniref:MBL fold metallo-hydrolase n=1 Tax=Petrimonas sp. TaxID=2023866 RepID=UPI003F513F39